MENKKLPKLDLNITNRCNFRCTHCAFDSGKKLMEELSLKKIRQILKETKELGGERFDITGGEPLVRKDVNEIIKIGKKLGYRIELITNGSLLSKNKLLIFKKLKLDSIAISLDGSNYKTYNRIRKTNKNTYLKIIKNIGQAVRIGLNVKINTVVFKSNLNDIIKITQFCIKNKVKEHGLYYFTPIGRGEKSNEFAVEPIKWLKFLRKKLSKYKNKIKISIEFPLIEKNILEKEIKCIANTERYHLQILPNGNVYPCVILASYNKPIGNLNSTSIKEIWNNERLWKAYWAELTKIFRYNCGYCVNFKKAFSINKYNLNKFDFVCPLRKFLLEDLK